MAKYRKISPKIWNDAKFRALSDDAKLVFFMLLTHPLTSALGTLRAYPQGLAPEIGWEEKGFRKAFQEVLEKGMAKCAEKDGLIWLPNFMRHNAPESPNVLRSWAGALEDCPECPMKNEIFESVEAFVEGLPQSFREAFADTFRRPSPNQEQEQEQLKDNTTPYGVVVGESSPTPAPDVAPPRETEPGEPGRDSTPSSCPYEKIRDMYHATFPEHPRVALLNTKRLRAIKSRWSDAGKRLRELKRPDSAAERLAYFQRLFDKAAKSDFLTGKKAFRDGSVYLVDFDKLMSPAGFMGVIEGKYDNRLEAW